MTETTFPLPFTCGHQAYQAGDVNDHGNTRPGWADPVDVDCFWWTTSSAEPAFAPTGGQPAVSHTVLVVDAALAVDHRDRFIVDGVRYDVDGRPGDYNHGPWSRPDRLVISLTTSQQAPTASAPDTKAVI